MKKIVRYRLPVSTMFPAKHARAGEQTFFREQINNAIMDGLYTIKPDNTIITGKKFHTIRANYALWEKRFDKILKGDAVLELYRWSGKPYRSKCETIYTLGKDNGIGLQKLIFSEKEIYSFCTVDDIQQKIVDIAENDGLFWSEFKEWFKNSDLSQPMAIIHFTRFRY